MDALVITSRDACCDVLLPKEAKSLKASKPDNIWLQSVAAIRPAAHEEFVKTLFEKQKTETRKIVISVDVPPELALKIAYATGVRKDPWIYFVDHNGKLTQIYASILH